MSCFRKVINFRVGSFTSPLCRWLLSYSIISSSVLFLTCAFPYCNCIYCLWNYNKLKRVTLTTSVLPPLWCSLSLRCVAMTLGWDEWWWWGGGRGVPPLRPVRQFCAGVDVQGDAASLSGTLCWAQPAARRQSAILQDPEVQTELLESQSTVGQAGQTSQPERVPEGPRLF